MSWTGLLELSEGTCICCAIYTHCYGRALEEGTKYNGDSYESCSETKFVGVHQCSLSEIRQQLW